MINHWVIKKKTAKPGLQQQVILLNIYICPHNTAKTKRLMYMTSQNVSFIIALDL